MKPELALHTLAESTGHCGETAAFHSRKTSRAQPPDDHRLSLEIPTEEEGSK